MSMDSRVAEKRRTSIDMEEMDDDSHLDHARSPSPKSRQVQADSEKRIRREIANSNERRRMQSINAGFQSLKAIIPHQEGEKLSKAAILHQAVEYITNLEQERTQHLLQNAQLRKRLKELDPQEGDGITPPPKRKKRDTESSDEGISMNFDDGTDIIELRNVLLRERQQRKLLEEKTRSLEAQLNPELLRQMPSHGNQMLMANDEKMEVDRKPEPVMMQSPPVASPLTPVCGLKLPLVSMPVSSPQEIPVKRNAPIVPAITSPQSKRNLEMIAEAIRHLEGEQCENCLFDKKDSHDFRSRVGSEESQTESSNSDQEDSKSESSGRGSPVLSASRDYIPGGLERQTATLHVSAPARMFAPMPLANIQMLQPHMYSQNGYIIHKS